MKRKMLLVALALVCALTCAFGLVACDNSNNDNVGTGNNGSNGGDNKPSHTHTYSTTWTGNETHHWHICLKDNCDEVSDKAAHTWDNGNITKEPTCTAKGEMTYTCTVCKATKTEEIATTDHTFSDKWESDDTHHWHKCINCDEISGKAEHSYNADGVCVCGYRAIPEETLPTTLNELMQEGNEKYQAVVVKTLNDHLLEDMLYKTVGNYNVNSVQIEQWEVVDSDKNGIIDCIKLHFFYDNAIISMLYRISCVEPKTEITLQDLLTENPDAAKLDEAFDRGTPYVNGAKYSTEYAFGYNPTIQEMRKGLLNAVNEKLANDGIISAVGGNTRSFIIRDDEATEDTTLGKARRIVVMNLTENGYEEIAIIIQEAQTDNDDTKLIENLNAGKYNVTSAAKRGKFTGVLLKADMSENGGTVTTD